jgi:hypothetical protein
MGKAVVAVLCALALTGCGRANAEPVAFSLDEQDNGQTVHVPVGADIVVTLHSTYWTFVPLATAGVLHADGAPAVAGGQCPPGVGCGTVIVRFNAVAAGTAQLTAARTSCGEALACGPGEGTFRVTIDVDA